MVATQALENFQTAAFFGQKIALSRAKHWQTMDFYGATPLYFILPYIRTCFLGFPLFEQLN